MKVLILTITAGEGHNATAAAIEKSLSTRGAECRVMDMYLKTNKALYDVVSKGYLLTTAEFKKAYSFVYTMLERRKGNSYTHSVTRWGYNIIKRRVMKYIEEYQPDVVVYTHVFAGILLDVLKQKHRLTAPTVGVVTDFAMHPFWEEALRTDRIVIANEMLLPGARRKGFGDNQISPTGIPIRPQFAAGMYKEEARRSLGMDERMPTVLLMGGSMGYGSLSTTVKELDALPFPLQILCVCGNNKQAKEEIDRMTFHNTVRNFGYTEQISLLMDAADCIVTKPGGLTTSEALAKRLPMIIANPIPGQEDRNAEFLLNNGVAVKISKTVCLSDVVYQLFSHPERIESMKKNIDLIRKPNAQEALSDIVFSLAGKETEPTPTTDSIATV